MSPQTMAERWSRRPAPHLLARPRMVN